MLSDFLEINGGESLRKGCNIQHRMWGEMMRNERPPSRLMFNRIVDYLAKGNPTRKKAFRDALWEQILDLTRHPLSINMKVMVAPMPAPRPRLQMSGMFPRVYNPPKYTKWKRDFALMVGNIGHITGPCRIYVEYHTLAKSKPLGPHTKQADIDNFDKAFLDALQDNGLIDNDKDVYWMDSRKYNSFEDCVKFTIWYDTIYPNKKGLL